MFVRVLITCFAGLLFVSNGEALSFLPIDVVNVESTKGIMGQGVGVISVEATMGVMRQGFQLEYRTLLTAFLSQWIFALENAATELRASLSADDPNYVKYTVIIDGARQQRTVLEDGASLNNGKLAEIIVRIKEFWAQLRGLNPDTSKYQAHLDRVRNAWYTFCKVVLTAWTHAAALVGLVDTSRLDGYDSLNADILKVKDVPITADNESVFTALMSRILTFFGVDASLNFYTVA